MSKVINKKLHPYYKTGINGWIGEEVDDNDYIICPICGEVLGMNYCDYASEQGYNNQCPKCKQELDYSEIYDFEDTCYFEQLLKIKESRLADLEAKLADLQAEQIKEMQEHQEAMLVADKTIKNLESKLAENESELEKQKEKYDKLYGCYKKTSSEDLQDKYCLAEENEKLKHQLAEKEADLIALDTDNYSFKQQIDNLRQQLAEKDLEIKNLTLAHFERETNKPVLTTTQIINQDKISFAIAELKKVRDWCIGVNENNKMYGFQKEPNLENCADIAQNRINDLKQQLKEKK